MELQAQLPDEFGALIDGDSVPKQGVRIGLRFLLAVPEDPDLGASAHSLSALGIGSRDTRLMFGAYHCKRRAAIEAVNEALGAGPRSAGGVRVIFAAIPRWQPAFLACSS